MNDRSRAATVPCVHVPWRGRDVVGWHSVCGAVGLLSQRRLLSGGRAKEVSCKPEPRSNMPHGRDQGLPWAAARSCDACAHGAFSSSSSSSPSAPASPPPSSRRRCGMARRRCGPALRERRRTVRARRGRRGRRGRRRRISDDEGDAADDGPLSRLARRGRPSLRRRLSSFASFLLVVVVPSFEEAARRRPGRDARLWRLQVRSKAKT